jgi:anti-sigma regulatory factor (Ser/Thr protein kinase)
MFLLEFDACDETSAKTAREALIDYLALETVGADLNGVAAIYGELVSNVCKHAGRLARVSVRWRRDGFAVLAVADYGPGFDLSEWHAPDRLAEHGRGMIIVSALTRDFSVHQYPEGCGTRVEAVLPLRRRLTAA